MTEYKIVKHNENLYAVMSHVTNKDWSGRDRVYVNFVGESESYEGAKSIVQKAKKYG